MTFALTRFKESLVDKFGNDVELMALTGDQIIDEAGNSHHIGLMLYEPGLKDRTPFIGFDVMETSPLLPGDSRTHLFRSVVWVHCISREQCKSDLIADRIQYLLTTPEDDNCNGFYDFSNNHITTVNSEFRERFNGPELKTGFDDNPDTYNSVVEFSVIWRDTPCCGEVEEPDCLPGLDDTPDEPEICEDDFE